MVKKHSRLKPKPVNVLEAQVRHSIVEYLGARPEKVSVHAIVVETPVGRKVAT